MCALPPDALVTSIVTCAATLVTSIVTCAATIKEICKACDEA
jgi:hypothetical protein